ncbi:D-threitol dehydrogenase [Actinobacteria bacterium YIM 96077]|uniref:D-threitol dehydrogenase n=1 Tax=Phytoactinopolyspora halophila TaxID=1981511 RepID=A0A329QZW5_9ACTN|nr:D-threitol dehydrogenase [Phytoactinopolyspora halophila]AYY11677.1 D-threitol dehydrogenase [Actinobacteria bacterium YIM 96077]RAW17890.1 D-threitol dehydrogenase [Phytoactinopolyspora halophila]
MNTRNNRVTVVTGGASGIGAAIVEAMAAPGSPVVVLDRDVSDAPQPADAAGPHAVRCDITDPDAVSAAVQQVNEGWGPVGVLVNCAGVASIAPALDLELAGWEQTLRVNLTGTFLMSQAVAPQMIEQGSGRIINIASQAATVALHDHAAYAASKAGVVGLTKVLALEWGGSGITVNAVSPTVVLTELSKPIWENPGGDALKAQIPAGRFAQPHEIAATVAFLASDEAAMINGVDLLVDGGYTIR